MIAIMGGANGWRGSWLRKLMWGGAIFLLLLPAAAMRFTAEVNWTASDFIFAGLLLFGSAGFVELAARASRSPFYFWGAVFAVGISFLTIWVNGAVGMVGSEDNPYNAVFLGVVGFALVGSAMVRFRARFMAWVMAAAAAGQAAAGAIGIATDPRGGTFAMLFAGAWLISAGFFREARTNEDGAG